jgi:two-component system OmpR family response regulator
MRDVPLLLVVDDDANFREIFSMKLKAAGFVVEVAKNEAEALVKSKELMPDLTLMDIYMPPGPSGTDVALNIKQHPETKDLKIAFLTNLKEPWPALSGDHQGISRELGMEDFLEKTEDLDTIVQKVKDILSRGKTDSTNSPQVDIASVPPVASDTATPAPSNTSLTDNSTPPVPPAPPVT